MTPDKTQQLEPEHTSALRYSMSLSKPHIFLGEDKAWHFTPVFTQYNLANSREWNIRARHFCTNTNRYLDWQSQNI